MKILYAARMCRPDLLRAIGHLACFITKWAPEHDRRLHQLMCYIHTTSHLRMLGWVGDDIGTICPHIFSDADLAGCTFTQRSTSGGYICMSGPNSCFPIGFSSKRQGCVCTSSTESETVAAFTALKMFVLPALQLWDTLFPGGKRATFHEDNQAMIRVMRTGRNFSMRYATRTLRLPIAWMHERFCSSDINLT